MDLVEGAVIAGKLRLLRPLGQGGMGVVWAARHLALDCDVAVKFVRPERGRGDVARFEREARATARIAHPNVVKVMDYGAAFDVPYIVMELLAGASLAALLERGGRLSVQSAVVLARQVGAALACAHERGVVHRDVKPHNVFITEGSKTAPLVVKVLDFGIAKMLVDDQVPGGAATLTEAGAVVGSPPYMSPEQLEGRRDVDLRADLWSFGVVVYEALTGVQPFRGASIIAVGAAVLRGVYEPASELLPNLPRAIDDWFAKALSVDASGRFGGADEMAEAFARAAEASEREPSAPVFEQLVIEGDAAVAYDTTVDALAQPAPLAVVPEGETVAHAEAAIPPAPRPRRRGAWLAAAAALAIGGAGAGLFARAHDGGCPAGMVLVDGKTFQMGSDIAGETPSDETPKKTVTVASFCVDATEVTVKAYAACSTCERPMTAEFEGLTPNGRTFESQFCNGPDAADHPMNCVDWQQARGYCGAVGKRLPTEQEWELAARGEEGRTYPWGDARPSAERLNACGLECSRMLTERLEKVGKPPWQPMYAEDDAAPATSPVGRYRKGDTKSGIHDLAGNVWEWTDSAYCPYRDPACGDSRRVLRGGGWDTIEPGTVRAARRYPSSPTARGKSVGFRCAKTP